MPLRRPGKRQDPCREAGMISIGFRVPLFDKPNSLGQHETAGRVDGESLKMLQ